MNCGERQLVETSDRGYEQRRRNTLRIEIGPENPLDEVVKEIGEQLTQAYSIDGVTYSQGTTLREGMPDEHINGVFRLGPECCPAASIEAIITPKYIDVIAIDPTSYSALRELAGVPEE